MGAAVFLSQMVIPMITPADMIRITRYTIDSASMVEGCPVLRPLTPYSLACGTLAVLKGRRHSSALVGSETSSSPLAPFPLARSSPPVLQPVWRRRHFTDLGNIFPLCLLPVAVQ